MKWGALLLLFIAAFASAQSSIHQQIQETYNFQPHLLSKQEINDKSGVLDRFWTTAKSNPTIYIPGLRQELGNFHNPPFFLYDGSMLLLSLSDTPPDRKIALAAMARCNLLDVQTRDYFLQVHRMATFSQDTTAAAFHILDQPKFSVFIPQHVLTLGQDYSLIYMLLPTDQDYWLRPAVDRLKTEHDPTAQKSLLLLLWYSQTEAAEHAIASFSGDANQPSGSRTYARELANRQDKAKIGVKERTEASLSTEESLRQKRRERMRAVSDEALIDLDEYTLMLISKRN
jgi:hypothetical protein